MTYEFEIKKVIWHHNRGDFIFARHLGQAHDLDIPGDALLEDVPVYHYAAMRAIKDEEGMLPTDLFCFRPISLKRLDPLRFTSGQRVKLFIEAKA